MTLAASGQTIVLVMVAPFVIWAVVTLVVVLLRRRKRSLGDALESGIVRREVPSGKPIASQRGGAWVEGVSASWPFALLELYPTMLVLRSPQGLFKPMAVHRDDIGSLRIDRGILGPSLKVLDAAGQEIDFSFRVGRTASLRRTLSNAGWLGMLSASTRQPAD
jgi:hypothetical protein